MHRRIRNYHICYRCEQHSFEVWEYDVYYDFFSEERIIIPEDRWGIVIDDLDLDNDQIIELMQSYSHLYFLRRNYEHNDIDIELFPHGTACTEIESHNRTMIEKYISENGVYVLLHPGTTIILKEMIKVIDISKLPPAWKGMIYVMCDKDFDDGEYSRPPHPFDIGIIDLNNIYTVLSVSIIRID